MQKGKCIWWGASIQILLWTFLAAVRNQVIGECEANQGDVGGLERKEVWSSHLRKWESIWWTSRGWIYSSIKSQLWICGHKIEERTVNIVWGFLSWYSATQVWNTWEDWFNYDCSLPRECHERRLGKGDSLYKGMNMVIDNRISTNYRRRVKRVPGWVVWIDRRDGWRAGCMKLNFRKAWVVVIKFGVWL